MEPQGGLGPDDDDGLVAQKADPFEYLSPVWRVSERSPRQTFRRMPRSPEMAAHMRGIATVFPVPVEASRNASVGRGTPSSCRRDARAAAARPCQSKWRVLRLARGKPWRKVRRRNGKASRPPTEGGRMRRLHDAAPCAHELATCRPGTCLLQRRPAPKILFRHRGAPSTSLPGAKEPQWPCSRSRGRTWRRPGWPKVSATLAALAW